MRDTRTTRHVVIEIIIPPARARRPTCCSGVSCARGGRGGAAWRREKLEHDGLYQIPLPPGSGTGLGKPLKMLTHPVREQIPIHVAALGAANVRMTAELADGWLPMMTPGPELDEAMATIAASAEAAGRDPQTIGMEGRITWGGDLDQVKLEAEQWRALGATHVSINTMGSGLGPVAAHLEVLAQVAQTLELR